MPKTRKQASKPKRLSASSVHAARVKLADLVGLPVGAVRLVLPGGRPQLALGSMELEELRTKWAKWPHGK